MATPDPNDLFNVKLSRAQIDAATSKDLSRKQRFFGPGGVSSLGGRGEGFWESRPELTGSNLGQDWRSIRSTKVARRYNTWEKNKRSAREERDGTASRVMNTLDQHAEDQVGTPGGGVLPGVPSRGANRARYSSDQDIHDADVIDAEVVDEGPSGHNLFNARSVPREDMSPWGGGTYRGMNTSIEPQRAIGPYRGALGR